MSDISDCQNISDHSVTVPVNSINVSLNIIFNHGSLKLCTLICIEAYIICIFIEVQSGRIQLSGRTIGRLTIKPNQRFVLVRHIPA